MKHVRVVSRFDMSTGIGWHGWSFLQALSGDQSIHLEAVLTDSYVDSAVKEEVKKYGASLSTIRNVEGQCDIAIFCDVLGQSNVNDVYRFGKINCAYIVWDSNCFPPHFLEIIHRHFDFVVTPSDFVKGVLEDSHICVDVITLPLIVRRPVVPSSGTKSRFCFGIVASFEVRKNIDLLVASFMEAFGDSADLRIHLSYAHEPDHKLREFILRYASSNITITCGFVSRSEYEQILASIDCLVCLSSGEGFSIVPREYMHFGRPVILSDVAAHSDIPSMNGVWFVESRIPEPALYPQIDGAQYGVFRSPYHEDVVMVLKEVLMVLKKGNYYHELPSYASGFSLECLRSQYLALVNPKHLIQSSSSRVSCGGNLYLKSPSLIRSFERKDAQTGLNKHVVLANDGGFFSIFNRYLSILVHELEKDPTSVVLPDWRISALEERLGHAHFTSFCYGSRDDGNIYLKLFEAPKFDIPIDLYNDHLFLRNQAILRTDYNEVDEPNLTYIHAYKLYKNKDFNKWRHLYHRYFQRHIVLQPGIQRKINEFIQTHFEGFFVISAHIRHPSHAMEQPGQTMPALSRFKQLIDICLSKALKSQSLPVKVFIATDQSSVIDYFQHIYGQRIISTNAMRASSHHDKVFNEAQQSERLKEGYQIQHIMASDSNRWSTRMAVEVLVDAWLLAASNQFIHTTSNISTAVSYINPDVEMIYCE